MDSPSEPVTQIKAVSKFERIARLHTILSFSIGVLIYTQHVKDIVTLLGVSNESPHSLRNTGFLFILVSIISCCAISSKLRIVPEFIGSKIVGSHDDKSLNFVAGFAALTNVFLLMHYTIEAFVYGDVSKIFTSFAWLATFFAAAGVSVSVAVVPKKSD